MSHLALRTNQPACNLSTQPAAPAARLGVISKQLGRWHGRHLFIEAAIGPEDPSHSRPSEHVSQKGADDRDDSNEAVLLTAY